MSLSANNGGNCEMDVGGCKTNNSALSSWCILMRGEAGRHARMSSGCE